MASRRRILRIVLLVGLAFLIVLVAALGYAWWKVNRIIEANYNGKAYSNTAYDLQEFVTATGRWPESEEEFINWEGGSGSGFDRQEEASRTIIVYDVDLATEDLENAETFRLLRPRYPDITDKVFVEFSVETLLETLCAARDGELPAPAPVGQASPDDAEEASGDEEGGSREGSPPEEKAAAK